VTLTSNISRKVTISLPADLLAYADAQAERRSTSRSQVISEALAARKAAEEEALAAEGYRYYAAEASAFAEASAEAVAEALGDGR
jgi:metal-responsive CopG/Arc/MetJ family transcriptional regulator